MNGASRNVAAEPIRTVTFTSLYPNAAQPHHGLFVEHRLRHLLASGAVRSRVVAPVPWFPSAAGLFGRYARYARVPAREMRHGVEVLHPRYPVVPKIGMNAAPWLMARALRSTLRAERDAGFDLIDAHYFYPDGVAAAMLGARLGKPVVITARGTDINVIARYAGPRRQILRAAEQAAAIVTVSAALRDALQSIGINASKIITLINGVDLELFHPDAARAARQPGDGVHLLSVGNLLEAKGHHLVIEALSGLDAARLTIVGAGPMRAELERRIRELDLQERVTLTGAVTQAALREHYAAADLLILATEREGMPNVVLEALACGTPVIATRTGGAPEVIDAPAAGLLLDERTPRAIAAAVRRLLASPPARNATRRHAERFGWAPTTRGQIELFRSVLRRRVDEAA